LTGHLYCKIWGREMSGGKWRHRNRESRFKYSTQKKKSQTSLGEEKTIGSTNNTEEREIVRVRKGKKKKSCFNYWMYRTLNKRLHVPSRNFVVSRDREISDRNGMSKNIGAFSQDKKVGGAQMTPSNPAQKWITTPAGRSCGRAVRSCPKIKRRPGRRNPRNSSKNIVSSKGQEH